MTKLYLMIFIVSITACSNDRQEIETLRIENSQLKAKLKAYENEIKDFEFSALLTEKDNKVKKGEEYIADIGLVISKKTSPIRVQLGTFENNIFQKQGDNLEETWGEYRVYRQSNLTKGKYELGGKIEFDFFDSTVVRYFKTEYIVE